MLITVTGRKTGNKYTTPVGYYKEDGYLWVITNRDRTWWRNLKDGVNVNLRLRGKDVTGFAEAVLNENAVGKQIRRYVKHIPMSVRALGIRMENGSPKAEDVARLARERLFVKIKLK